MPSVTHIHARSSRCRVGRLAWSRGNMRRFSVRGGFPFATAPGTDGVVTARAGGEPNAISLGHFPEYLDLGARTGARTFSLSDEAFNAMSPEEQWTSIRRFLDRAVERGSEIRLATPIDAIRPGSFLEREVPYLLRNRVVPSPDGTMLMPGAPRPGEVRSRKPGPDIAPQSCTSSSG